MVRQQMIMDEHGAVYFMMKGANDNVKVLRTDPLAEMGGDGFVKTIFSFRSAVVYFMLYHQGQFYIMDDQKKIRLLTPNQETKILK